METRIGRTLRRLGISTKGNATLLIAIGMPVLIGGSGLAVDTAQWYLWKRELQNAVDQAALAGAWARTNADTQSIYAARANQEYSANIAVVADFDVAPTVVLANHGSGTNNSVVVTGSVTKSLPFSSILTGKATTVVATAQAAYETGTTHTACMIALHPTASGAFTLGGNASGDAACGVAALSTSDSAMVKNGNSDTDLGSLVAGGGIDDGLEDNGTLHPNTPGLTDPFAGLTAPSSAGSPSRTYSCPTAGPASTVTTANVTTRTVTTYTYRRGANANNAVAITYTSGTGYLANTDVTTGPTSQTVTNGSVNGTTVVGPTAGTATNVAGSGQNRIWRTATVTTYTTLANVNAVTTGGSDGIARPLPGSYSSINIACQTEFNSGIYFISGDLDFGQNQTVTGSDVMFVIASANGMHINSNSSISLSGITEDTLINTYGYSDSQAAKMAGMLFYDPNSTDQIKINGNADVELNGIIYTPKRELWFNGTSSVSGSCMMLVASKLTFTGTVDLNSFCLPSGSNLLEVGGGVPSVKLVA